MKRPSVTASIRFAVLAASTLGTMHCAQVAQANDGGDGGTDMDVSVTEDNPRPVDGPPDGGTIHIPPGLVGPGCNVMATGNVAALCTPVRVTFSCGIPAELLRPVDGSPGNVTDLDPNGQPHPGLLARSLQMCADLGITGAGFALTYANIARSNAPNGPPDTLTCGSFCAGRATEAVDYQSAQHASQRQGESAMSNYLAEMAQLEAGSVIAFEHLASELTAFGAPAQLVQWARANAEDERVHASIMGKLAQEHGAELLSYEVRPVKARSLLDVAIENRVEGCVRETLGAAVGAWQLEHAQNEGIREALSIIVSDELRHAEWSFAMNAWAMDQLSDAQRAQVEQAMERAVSQLSISAVAEDFRREIGLPTPSEMQVIIAQLRERLWS